MRIRPPEGLGEEGLGELALMIAPITGRPAEELEAALGGGPLVVASELEVEEAEQLVAVFTSLGATAELVRPEPERPLFSPEESIDDAWRSVRTTQPQGSGVKATLPFDAGLLRDHLAAAEQGPAVELQQGVKATQPFDPRMVGEALELAKRHPVDPDPATIPLKLDELGPDLRRLESDPHGLPTQQLDAEELREAIAREQAISRTQPFDARAVRSMLGGATSAGEPPPFVPPTGEHQLDPFDQGGRATQKLELDAATQKLELDAATHKLDALDAPTRPRPVVTLDDDEAYHRATIELDASTVPRLMVGPADVESTQELGAAGRILPAAPDTRRMVAEPRPASTSATTAKFLKPEKDPLFATGDMGSVQAGPLIFKLDQPLPQPTDTGSVPRPVNLAAMTGEIESVPRSSALPAEADPTPVAGRYKLGERAEATPAPERVVSITPPEEPRPLQPRPPVAAAASRRKPDSGSFQVVGADGVPQYLAPARRSPPPASPAIPDGAGHSVGMAVLLGLVLPGMGQVYNGERDRAVWFAIGAVLVLPWLYGVFDALSVARAIVDGERPPPDPATRGPAVRGHLMLNMAMVFGVVVGVFLWFSVSDQQQRVALPPPAPAPAAIEAPDAMPADSGPSAAEIQVRVDELMAQGRRAFGRGRYAECEEIMHAIIKLDPSYREAHTLLVDAVSRRSRPQRAPDGGAPPQ